MTEQDIEKFVDEWFSNIKDPEYSAYQESVGMILAMVRRHNEELTANLMPLRHYQFARGINLAIQVIREAKP